MPRFDWSTVIAVRGVLRDKHGIASSDMRLAMVKMYEHKGWAPIGAASWSTGCRRTTRRVLDDMVRKGWAKTGAGGCYRPSDALTLLIDQIVKDIKNEH